MSDDRADLLAGGEQKRPELLESGKQRGADLLAGGEQKLPELLSPPLRRGEDMSEDGSDTASASEGSDTEREAA